MAALAYDIPKLSNIPMDLVSIPDAAHLAGCPVAGIYRSIAKGDIRCWGTPGRYRVSVAEVLPEHPSTEKIRLQGGNERQRHARRTNGNGNLKRATEPPKVKTAAQPVGESTHKDACPICASFGCYCLQAPPSTVVGSE